MPRLAHAQRTVQETFYSYSRCGNLGNFLKSAFSGAHHRRCALCFKKFRTVAVVTVKLRACRHLEGLGQTCGKAHKRKVGNYHAVGICPVRRKHRFFGRRQFVVFEGCVYRNVNLHPENVTIIHPSGQIFRRKVGRFHSGIEVVQPQIDAVAPVIYRRRQLFFAACRRKYFVSFFSAVRHRTFPLCF